MKCDCGRKLNLTDWHNARCIECKEAIEYTQWLNLLEALDDKENS
jgi:hypothetical protein